MLSCENNIFFLAGGANSGNLPESRYYTYGRTSAVSVGSRLLQSRATSCSNPDIAGIQSATDEEVKSIMSSRVRRDNINSRVKFHFKKFPFSKNICPYAGYLIPWCCIKNKAVIF